MEFQGHRTVNVAHLTPRALQTAVRCPGSFHNHFERHIFALATSAGRGSAMPLDDASPGDTVLVRGTVTADGLIVVGPGIEVSASRIDVVCAEAPRLRRARALMLYFNNDEDMQDFVETFQSAYSLGEAVPIGVTDG